MWAVLLIYMKADKVLIFAKRVTCNRDNDLDPRRKKCLHLVNPHGF